MPSQGVHLISNSKSFLDHYNEWKTGNLQSISMALAATKCWFIWKERCLRIFENKNRTPEKLAIDIARNFAYWHPENRIQNTSLSSKQSILYTKWNLPSTNTNKINCDASWLFEITNAEFGFILRNWTGTFQAAAMGSCRTFSSEEAEAVALLRATQWVVTNNIHHLVIEGTTRKQSITCKARHQ